MSEFYHISDGQEGGQQEDDFFRQVVERFPDDRNLVAAEKHRTWKRDRKPRPSPASAVNFRAGILVHLAFLLI